MKEPFRFNWKLFKKKNKDEKNQLDTMLDEWSSSVFPVHC